MNHKKMLDSAWGYLSPHFPEASELLNHAKQIGANATSNTTTVMAGIEKFMEMRGRSMNPERKLLWDSFKGKSIDELPAHFKKCAMASGKMDTIMNVLTGENNK